MTDLSTYKSIQSNIFVRIQVDYYKSSEGSSPTSQILRFSDRTDTVTINGESYTGVGNLMGITDSTSELQATGSQLTITLSGIPNSSIYEIVNSKIKGSPIKIYRAFYDANTGSLLPITTNPLTKFSGFINNYSLQEEYDIATLSSSNTIILVCSNTSDVLSKKIGGRRTNDASMKRHFPTDVSMDRVSTLTNAYFDFGSKS